MNQLSNQLRLTAILAERESTRYTPAGVPIVTARLQHQSEQQEAGLLRSVEMDIAAMAAGEISGRLEQAAVGQMFHFTGFLTRRSRNSKSLVFHITDIET